MKLKLWEIMLAVVLLLVLTGTACLRGQQAALADKLIRLHVVAHSDKQEDQTLKLEVRDAVLERMEPVLAGAQDRDTAAALVTAALPELTAAAQETVRAAGYTYPVTVSLRRELSPTKAYDTFALPAGEYMSLRVSIGDAAGENWWCVLYPPLCTAAALDRTSAAALTDAEIALITGGGGAYTVRFRCIELLGQLRALFNG